MTAAECIHVCALGNCIVLSDACDRLLYQVHGCQMNKITKKVALLKTQIFTGWLTQIQCLAPLSAPMNYAP